MLSPNLQATEHFRMGSMSIGCKGAVQRTRERSLHLGLEDIPDCSSCNSLTSCQDLSLKMCLVNSPCVNSFSVIQQTSGLAITAAIRTYLSSRLYFYTSSLIYFCLVCCQFFFITVRLLSSTHKKVQPTITSPLLSLPLHSLYTLTILIYTHHLH